MSVVSLPVPPPPKPKRKRTKKTVIPPPSKWSGFKTSVKTWIEAKKWRADTVSYFLYFNNHIKEFVYWGFRTAIIVLIALVLLRYFAPQLFYVEVENANLKIRLTDGQTYECRPQRPLR